MGLTTDPHTHGAFEVALLAGGELGYRITKRIEIRAFYGVGQWDDHSLTSDQTTMSDYKIYGLKPQVNIFSTKKENIFFDIATPLSIWEQKSFWQSSDNFFFPVFGNTFSGEDKAEFFRFAIAPRLRLFVKKARLSFEFGPSLNFDSLRKSSRKVNYDTSNNAFANTEPTYRDVSYDFQVNIGYRFW